MVNTLLLSSCKHTISLSTDDKKLYNYFKKSTIPKIIIPGFSFEHEKQNVEGKIVHISKLMVPHWNEKNREFKMGGKFEKNINPPELAFIALKLFDRIYQEHGEYCIKSSCAVRNNEALLFISQEGYGKTSVCLKLCAEEGYHFLSNERTVLKKINGKFKIIGGTDYITTTIASLNDNFPHLKKHVKFQTGKEWYDRVELGLAEELGLQKYNKHPNLRAIIFVNTTSSKNSIRKINFPDSLITLYREFSKMILGEVIVNNFSSILPSFDNELLSLKRLEFIKDLVKKVPIYEVGGNLTQVIDLLLKI